MLLTKWINLKSMLSEKKSQTNYHTPYDPIHIEFQKTQNCNEQTANQWWTDAEDEGCKGTFGGGGNLLHDDYGVSYMNVWIYQDNKLYTQNLIS